MKTIAEIPKARGYAVRVSRDRFRDRERIDVREFYEVRPGDPDTRQPTKKGISLPIDQLPQLRAALEEAERGALAAGLLEVEGYTNAGLPVPPELLGTA